MAITRHKSHRQITDFHRITQTFTDNSQINHRLSQTIHRLSQTHRHTWTAFWQKEPDTLKRRLLGFLDPGLLRGLCAGGIGGRNCGGDLRLVLKSKRNGASDTCGVAAGCSGAPRRSDETRCDSGGSALLSALAAARARSPAPNSLVVMRPLASLARSHATYTASASSAMTHRKIQAIPPCPQLSIYVLRNLNSVVGEYMYGIILGNYKTINRAIRKSSTL